MKALNGKLAGRVVLIGLIALLAAGGTALAQQPGCGRGDGPDGCFLNPDGARFGPEERGPGSPMRLERLTEALDLTEEQSAAIKEIQEKQHAAKLELRKELMRLRNARQGELLKDEPSKRAVLDLTEQMNKVQGKMHLNAMETRLAVRELLTPEQRDKMLMMDQGRSGHRGSGRRGAAGFDRQGSGDRRAFERNHDCPLADR